MDEPRAEEVAWTGGKNPWAIALVVTLATFMEMLDTSIANVALPHIAGTLSATQDQSTWVLTSYLLANAVVLPISGWLATKLGRKRYYMLSVVLFTVSSLLCGLAPSLGWLVVFRLLQGIGGGGLAPIEQAILSDTFPPAKRGMAMAVYGMSVIVAPAIGPSVGGYITDHHSWRWIFLVNVPIGVVSLVLTQRLVSDPPHMLLQRAATRSIDYIGLTLIVIGLGCLQLVLSRGQEEDWLSSRFITACCVTSALALLVFVWWELQHPQPIVALRILKNPNFAATNLMLLFAAGVLYGTTVLLPQYVQGVMHYSAMQAGAVLTPGGLGMILLMPIVGTLVGKTDARFLIVFGFAALATSLIYMSSLLHPGIDMATAIELRCYQTIGVAFLFVPINTVAYDSITPERRNAASGILNLTRNLGAELGISIVTTLIGRGAQRHQARLVEHSTVDNPIMQDVVATLTSALHKAGELSHEAQAQAYALIYRTTLAEAAALSYIDTLQILAIGSACMIPTALLIQRPKR